VFRVEPDSFAGELLGALQIAAGVHQQLSQVVMALDERRVRHEARFPELPRPLRVAARGVDPAEVELGLEVPRSRVIARS